MQKPPRIRTRQPVAASGVEPFVARIRSDPFAWSIAAPKRSRCDLHHQQQDRNRTMKAPIWSMVQLPACTIYVWVCNDMRRGGVCEWEREMLLFYSEPMPRITNTLPRALALVDRRRHNETVVAPSTTEMYNVSWVCVCVSAQMIFLYMDARAVMNSTSSLLMCASGASAASQIGWMETQQALLRVGSN